MFLAEMLLVVALGTKRPAFVRHRPVLAFKQSCFRLINPSIE
jgi:hypothetical protein